jgi:hypothetical protein
MKRKIILNLAMSIDGYLVKWITKGIILLLKKIGTLIGAYKNTYI